MAQRSDNGERKVVVFARLPTVFIQHEDTTVMLVDAANKVHPR